MLKISSLSKISIGIIVIVATLLQFLFSFPSQAVITDETASNWTREKAEHLARRTLIGPTNQMVTDLYNAGSAVAATNILFPDQNGPDRTIFDAEFAHFTGSGWMQYVATGGINYTNYSHMYKYYQFRYARDPYEAKMKLSSLFEDIFAVNISEGISFRDLNNLYGLIYTNTLGNYKTLLKKTLLNNPIERGDYAVPHFLNNIRNWDKNNPNENYARELLQLMMMGEYKPGDSKDIGSIRNYSEEDVAVLARILTGFWSDSAFPFNLDSAANSYFTGAYHNRSTALTFLPGSTGSAIFPFYSGGTDTLNLLTMETPILGNNGVGDNTIDYIFAKRSHEIALFLADKIFRFYIHETPTMTDLENIATELESNNFEILPTVKWILSQDMMYTNIAMNSILYKNPIELSIGLFKTIHANDPATIDTNFYQYDSLLTSFGWNPYIPGSIFGRDGFDQNYKWFSGYTEGQWVNMVTRVMSDYTRTGAYLISNIVPITTESGSDISMDRMIEQAENNLYLGRRLSTTVKNQIKTYLTTSETGSGILFQPNVTSYRNLKFPGVFALMLSQPEYILKSGYDNPTITNTSMPSQLDSASGSLFIIELPGGYDWLHGIIRKSDYSYYNQLRTDLTGTTIAHTEGSLVDIGEYYMSPFLAYSGGNNANGPAFKSLLDDGTLKIFNRVGTSSHARDHLQAQNQIVSIDNSTVGGIGLIGDLTKFESNATNTVVLGSSRPKIYQAGNYINLGGSDNRMFHANPGGRLNTNQKNQLMNTIMGTLTGRTYPGKIEGIFTDSIKIHNIAAQSVASGGSAGVGSNTKSQLNFAKTMLAGNVGKIFYLANTGNGYDTHANENTTANLNGGIGYLAQSVTEFFNQVRATEKVTIVIYSEFGRTNAMNGTAGTDHGQGGGMFVISNDPNVQSSMTGSFYGRSDLQKERNNWMSPGIDYRSVYGKVLGSLFGVPEKGFFKKFYGSLENDISTASSAIKLLRTQYRATSDTVVEISAKYKVEDSNFDITKGAYTIASYGTGMSFMQPYAVPFYVSYSGVIRSDITTYSRILSDASKTFTFNPALNIGKRFNEFSPYIYTLELVNNQLTSTYFTGTTSVPEAITASVSQISLTGNSILRKYDNRIYSGSTNLTGSGIFIKNNTGSTLIPISNSNGIQMSVNSGVTQGITLNILTGSVLWNGGFILGETLNPVDFIPTDAKQLDDSILLSNFTIDRLIRIGSDTLGIDIILNKPIELTMSGFVPNTGYLVMTSSDGYGWRNEFGTTVMTNSGGVLTFPTSHLSLFAVVQVPSLPVCSLVSSDILLSNGSSTTLQWSTLYADSVSIDQSIGNVTTSGSVLIMPPSSNNTNYTLSATNINGTTNCSAQIETQPLPSCTITTSSPSVRIGTSANIEWTGANTVAATLAPWGTAAPNIGSKSISPTIDTLYALTVSNAVGTGSCTTMVTTFPNTIPVAITDNVIITGSTLTGITVLTNDMDSDNGDIIRINTISTNPINGVASISSDTIMYSANPGYCGTDILSYTISDNYDGISIPATVSIQVNCPPDTTAPVITLTGSSTIDIMQGSGFVDPGASCIDNVDLVCSVISSGSIIDTNILGTNTITYTATDLAGNTSTETRVVNVLSSLDTVPPVITLTGSSTMDIMQGSGFVDPGASCTDNVDLVCSVISSGSIIDTNILGTNTITYTATDLAGNTSTETRVVNITNAPDTTMPVIILVGSGTISIEQGNGFIDPGASCTDNVDLVCSVISSGGIIDTNILGTNTITYTATDLAGNTSTETRVVNVIVGGSLSGSITTSITYTDLNIASTGSALISGTPLSFANGSTMNLINSNIVVTATGGSISISGAIDIIVSSGSWNSILSAPVLIDNFEPVAINLQEQGVLQNLPQNQEIAQNTFREYTHTVIGTYKAGGTNVELSLSGSTAFMTIAVSNTLNGKTLQILRSQNGSDWDLNSPDSSCTVDESGLCGFQTNHFTYFGAIDSEGSINISIPTLAGAGGGGGSSNYQQTEVSMSSTPKSSNTPTSLSNNNIQVLIPKLAIIAPSNDRMSIYKMNMNTLFGKIPMEQKPVMTPTIQQAIYALFLEMWRDTMKNENPQKYKDTIVDLFATMHIQSKSRLERIILNSMSGNINKMIRVEKLKKTPIKSKG